jgi:hypothetical protein
MQLWDHHLTGTGCEGQLLLLLLLLLLLCAPGVVVEQVVEDEERLALPHLVADLGKQPAAQRERPATQQTQQQQWHRSQQHDTSLSCTLLVRCKFIALPAMNENSVMQAAAAG